MIERQLHLLNNKRDHERPEIIAEGLELIARNVRSLLSEAEGIYEQAPRSAKMAVNVASEEAGKGFLLVDYVRPYSGVKENRRQEHLRGFYSHLSRGIYAKYYKTRPKDFADVMEIIDCHRQSLYLDGLHDVDLILRNEILREREDLLYVDYVLFEDGPRWVSPESADYLYDWYGRFRQPTVCVLFLHMYQLGLFTANALRVLRAIWKDQLIAPETDWSVCAKLNERFLEKCGLQGILTSNQGLRMVVDRFLFPLCGLGLPRHPTEVKIEDLQEKRDTYWAINYGDGGWEDY
jgi:hypothetical protein